MKLKIISELFDTRPKAVEYKEDDDNEDLIYSFRIGNYKYDVYFSQEEFYNTISRSTARKLSIIGIRYAYSVLFKNETKDSFGITNTGNSQRVFANVLYIIQEFVSNTSVDLLMFTAKEQSRKKLYKALVKRMIPSEFNYIVRHVGGQDMYILYKTKFEDNMKEVFEDEQ